MRLQDPCDRRAANPMPHVLERALDPRVAPRRILPRHPQNQSPDLDEDAATMLAGSLVRPFTDDQLPVPPQQRVRRHTRGDLAQRATPHPDGARREPPPVVIGEAKASPTQLPSQEAVLFDQVRDRVPLPAL
jgi:hypothetical protein